MQIFSIALLCLTATMAWLPCCGDDSGGNEDTDTGTDTGVDMDTDSDTDTDCDTDTDSDVDSGPDADTDSDTDTDTETDTGQAPSEWIVIQPGSFWMGSPDGSCPPDYPGGADYPAELGRFLDEDLHYVKLTHSFEILSTEVTQGQYEEVMGWNPSFYGPANIFDNDCGLDCPVEQVSWYDALAYANELSKRSGFAECYVMTEIVCSDGAHVGTDYLGCMNKEQYSIRRAEIALNGVGSVYECKGYRLPTEAEWEYAARAGSNTAFYPSEGNDGSIAIIEGDPNMDQIGWCHPLAEGKTHPSGFKEANEWGLCDTSGNVEELTWDLYEESYPSGDTLNPVVDPEGPSSSDSDMHVTRGGCYSLPAAYSRSARRSLAGPGGGNPGLGFRLVRSLVQGPII